MAKRHIHLALVPVARLRPEGLPSRLARRVTARWMIPDLFVDLARSMERAGFDCLKTEDSSMAPYTFRRTRDT